MNLLKRTIHFVANGLAVLVSAELLEGVQVADFWIALLIVIVVSILNILVKPFLLLFSLPINILTLGLFTWVIDAALVMLAAFLIPGFVVSDFLTGILFSFVLALISFIFDRLLNVIF